MTRPLGQAGLLALAALWLGVWPAASEPQRPLFPADQEACFRRVYDAAHLGSHPRQKAARVFVMRELGRRREAEDWTPQGRQEAIRSLREDGITSVTAFVTFRDRKGIFHNSLTCEKETAEGVSCLIECDGGSFRLARAGANAAMLHNNGFVLIGGCGEEVEEGNMIHFSPGADDKVFRLDASPIAACRAEEQRATPIPAGVPLRERFKEDETFCFGRDYDAAHLAKNTQQLVTKIRVGRLAPAKEKDEDAGVVDPHWWFNVKLDVSLTLRSGREVSATRYACSPREASWECHRQMDSENPTACRDRRIHLVRTTGEDRPSAESKLWPAAQQRMRHRADRRTVPEATADQERRSFVSSDPNAACGLPAMTTRCNDAPYLSSAAAICNR
jgi:hypothetical protein